MPFSVVRPGRSYSSNATPRARSASTVAGKSSTSNPIWVKPPSAAPADWNKANSQEPTR